MVMMRASATAANEIYFGFPVKILPEGLIGFLMGAQDRTLTASVRHFGPIFQN